MSSLSLLFNKILKWNYFKPIKQQQISIFLILVEIRGRQLLEEPDTDETFEVDRMSKRWYKACMNETHIEKLGVAPLLESLRKIGGWPVLGEDDESKYESFKWYEQTTKLNVEGFSIDTIMTHSISLSLIHI